MLLDHVCLLFHIFSDNIEALNNVWIIGDSFINDCGAALQDLKRAVLVAGKSVPYVYERYNVSILKRSPLTLDAFPRILNAFIEGLNGSFILPKYVIIVPDKDLLQEANFFNFGISCLLGTCLNWIAKQMEKLLYTRREALFKI